MRPVFRRLAFLMGWLLIFVATDGCVLNPFSSGETLYRIETIDSRPVEEFLRQGSHWPVELRFSAMPPGQPYKGKILLAMGEWKKTDNASMSKDAFDVSVTDRDTNPGAYVVLSFSQLEIRENSLSGMVGLWGPHIMSTPYDFIAIRQ